MVYDFRNVSILDLSDCQFVCNKIVFDFYTMSLGKALGPGDQELVPPHIMGWDDGRGYSCYDDEAQKVVTFREYIAQAPGTDQGNHSVFCINMNSMSMTVSDKISWWMSLNTNRF